MNLAGVRKSHLVKLMNNDASIGPNTKSRKPTSQGEISK